MKRNYEENDSAGLLASYIKCQRHWGEELAVDVLLSAVLGGDVESGTPLYLVSPEGGCTPNDLRNAVSVYYNAPITVISEGEMAIGE
jgi:hypothetical protein